MTSSGNEQDLVFKAKFEDDASEDIKSLDGDVENLDESMGGLSMSSVAAGLAMFGVGVGVQQVIQGSIEAHKRITATKALMSLLPEAAQMALADLAPFYSEIGDKVGATNREVEETAVAITTASGGIAPSLQELQLVYDLIATTGTDSATAAAAVGEALRGNQEPLQAILGDKYNFHSLEEVLGKLGGTAEKAKTPLDDLTASLRTLQQEGVDEDSGLMSIINSLTAIPGLALAAMNALDELNEPTVGEGLQVHDDLEQELIDQGVFGVGAAGAGAFASGEKPMSIGITINGDVDSAQRVAIIMRQVELQIRNIYRGGINTIVDTRMFPN